MKRDLFERVEVGLDDRIRLGFGLEFLRLVVVVDRIEMD